VIADKLNIKYKWSGSDPYSTETGDPTIAATIIQYAQQTKSNSNDFLNEAWKISEAMAQAISIDNFMDAHRDNSRLQLCGKLAIVQVILEAEASSDLMFDEGRQERFDPKKLSDTWYENFFKLLTENVRKEDLGTIFDNVSFIIFNYDRCVERFLYFSLQNYCAINEQEAATLLGKLQISHPYGLVGPLLSKTGAAVSYGGRYRGMNLVDIAGLLKTFTERIEDEATRDSIRQQIQQAEAVVFLGFAFHPLNIELITPEFESNVVRVFGTAIGISDADLKLVLSDIEQMLKKVAALPALRFKKTDAPRLTINIDNSLRCSELFSHYWRSLQRI
jgi:hypothetical protein